ncbi:tetratricopeptide repeat protein [Permianibacter sp. IMCC34836]|uniref:YbgF trimerization domain-containing protein n=1 Tax=Permianibacter fluminis TaxID=2738515 RepID=UPI0015581301|nr:YbgF trimerization domain-containing protein [Permianibacter fluminis]NQD38614.1 tetratricopeptide repeat protein [Permianibacter fluminis]
MRKLKAAALVAALSTSFSRPLLRILALAAFTLPCVALAAAPVVSAETEQRQLQQATANQEQQAQLRNQVIADLQIQVNALQEDVRMLRGLVEEQDYKISQLLERQRELYRDIDRRLSGMPGAGGGASASTTEPATVNTVPSLPDVATSEPQVIEPVPAPAEPKPAKPAGKGSKDVEAEQKAYDAIFPLVRNKQYSEAVKAYSEFLSKFPDGRNAANARYWLGQVYYVQGSNEDAETQFKLVMSQYADSPKASDALAKLAAIEERRGALDKAKALA